MGDISEVWGSDPDAVGNHRVVLIRLPPAKACALGGIATPGDFRDSPLWRLCSLARVLAGRLRDGGKLLLLGEAVLLPYLHAFLEGPLRFHHWIAIRTKPRWGSGLLPEEHLGVTIYSKGPGPLDHARVRIAYEYCSLCGRTVKDYGGKKHLYDAYGTLMSDVWKDIAVHPLDSLPTEVLERTRDMFSVGDNGRMLAIPLRDASELESLPLPPLDPALAFPATRVAQSSDDGLGLRNARSDALFCGDALEVLPKIPDDSVDIAFADPPYNLSKGYGGYRDALKLEGYFGWCDAWLEHLCRVLRPGGALVSINIPQRAMRHFLYLRQRLTFRNWIVWESMSMPVRLIMPSHYPILLFTKGGVARTLDDNPLRDGPPKSSSPTESEYLHPIADGVCGRSSCASERRRRGLDPRKGLTDLWTDIHRVKHNSLRVDHPCQLPPSLMKRIIALLAEPGGVVLDCFNGVGTTTLCAQQLRRRYVGIELGVRYHELAVRRHQALAEGKDPFAKTRGVPAVKNNSVPRVRQIKYEVSKKRLQLAVKTLADRIGHIPSWEELARFGEYPLRYYDEYFRNWSEVTAAARVTGMSERRPAKLQ